MCADKKPGRPSSRHRPRQSARPRYQGEGNRHDAGSAFAVVNIIIALLLNILMDYIVIRSLDKIQRVMGENLIFILRKFFGVILLAIAVNMFVNNILAIIASVPK